MGCMPLTPLTPAKLCHTPKHLLPRGNVYLEIQVCEGGKLWDLVEQVGQHVTWLQPC
jgi:hypothetical protein